MNLDDLDFDLLSTASRIVIRASSTPELLDCPRRWAGRNLGKLLADYGYQVRSLPIHVGAPIGTGAHAAIAHMHRTKQATGGSLPPLEQAEEYGAVAMLASFEEAGAVTWDATAASLNDAHEQLHRLSNAYYEGVAPFVTAAIVEERMTVDWPEHPKFVVSGQLDQLLVYDPVAASLEDIKTGSRPKGVMAQVGTYRNLYHSYADDEALHRLFAPAFLTQLPRLSRLSGLAVQFGARVELRRPQPGFRRVELDMEEASRLSFDAIETAVRCTDEFLETGDLHAFPANPSSNLCTDRYCPLWGTAGCRAHLPFGLD